MAPQPAGPDHDQAYDVVVVGGGGSGLAAAASAAEHGCTVAVLEKEGELGGSTGMAVGSLTASRTVYQHKAGIQDRLEDHVEDVARFAPPHIEERNNGPLRRFLLAQAADTLDWLTDMGLVFHGPSPEPPNRVPRMHNVVPCARAYVLALQRQCLKRGVTVCCGARVEEVVKEKGRAVGVVVCVGGDRRTVRARRGVVLAAGDYSNAPDLIARHKGPDFAAIEGINLAAHGDGHRLAEAAGVQLVNMDVTYGPELRFVPPERTSLLRRLPASGVLHTLMGKLMPLAPRSVVNAITKRELVTWQHPEDALISDGAILVNQNGERFTNELVSPEREIAIAAQPGKIAYMLLDRRLAERYSVWPHFISTAPEIAYAYVADYLRLRPDVAVAGPTLRHVAQARAIPAEALERTVDAFNRCVASDEPDPWGRVGDKQPFAGDRWVLLGPARAYFTITEGGCAVNERLEALDPGGRPIPGLYAVGMNGSGGLILWGHGLHIAWAITSGRVLGERLGEARSQP